MMEAAEYSLDILLLATRIIPLQVKGVGPSSFALTGFIYAMGGA